MSEWTAERLLHQLDQRILDNSDGYDARDNPE